MVKLIINPDASEKINYNVNYLPVYIIEGALSEYPSYRAICHWHRDIEFMYIYEGTMDYNVNGDIITLQACQGLFVNSKSLHYGFSDTNTNCRYLCIIIDPYSFCGETDFSKLLDPLLNNSSIPYIRLSNSVDWQNNVLLSLVKLLQSHKKKCSSFHIMHQVLDIIELLMNNYIKASQIQNNDQKLLSLTQILGYIQNNYMNKISVYNLSIAGSLCKTDCYELFRNYLYTTPTSYLNSFRLEKSSQKLLQSNKTITEIAYECGFSSASYFCAAFQKHYKITPKEYRKQNG